MASEGIPVLHADRRRVLMDDTDAAGVTYFGCVFRWHEALVSSWLTSVGHPMRSMLLEHLAFPCVHSEADYTHALTVDDMLDMRLRPGRVGNTSFQLISEASLDGRHALTVRAVYVWARMPSSAAAGFQPLALPDWLRAALAGDRVPS
jgi:acyl-CoA thioesterase FadM